MKLKFKTNTIKFVEYFINFTFIVFDLDILVLK